MSLKLYPNILGADIFNLIFDFTLIDFTLLSTYRHMFTENTNGHITYTILSRWSFRLWMLFRSVCVDWRKYLNSSKFLTEIRMMSLFCESTLSTHNISGFTFQPTSPLSSIRHCIKWSYDNIEMIKIIERCYLYKEEFYGIILLTEDHRLRLKEIHRMLDCERDTLDKLEEKMASKPNSPAMKRWIRQKKQLFDKVIKYNRILNMKF